MKKKMVICLLLCVSILTGMTSVHAAQNEGKATIGYEGSNAHIVIVIEGKKEVIKGTANHSYKAMIDDKETPVVWTVKGATSKDTRIDEGGFLIVGVDETATEIEIVANSTENPAKFATFKVTLIEKTYTIVNVEKKPDIIMQYGTTESQLKNRLEEYDTFQVTIRTNDDKTYVIDVDRARYSSDKSVIGSNGIIKEGSFIVDYELILPHILINYDGKITTDKNKTTNIIGEAISSILVTIEKKDIDDSIKPDDSKDKPVSGTTYPSTGDTTKSLAYASAVVLLPIVILLLLYKKRKEEKEEEEA